MRWFSLIDGFGILCGAAYCGTAFADGWPAWWALGALGVFLVALAAPFFGEYRAVDRSFRDVEQDVVASRRPRPDVEIFTDHKPPSIWAEARDPVVLVGVLTLVGLAMVAWDVWGYLDHEPPPARKSGIISNF